MPDFAVATPGTSFAQTFQSLSYAKAMQTQSDQQQQLIQLEKQKENLSGFGAMQSLAALPPDQIENAAPLVANAIGVDPKDPVWKNTISNMADSQSAIGQSIIGMVKNIDPQTAANMTPSQALKMLGTPAGIKSLMNLSMTKQIMNGPGQGQTMDQQGQGQPTSGMPTSTPQLPNPAAPAMGTNAQPTMGAPQSVPPNGGSTTGQISGNGMGVQPGQSPAPIGSPQMYAQRASMADQLDSKAQALSVINPQAGTVLSAQASNIRTEAARVFNAAQTNKVGMINATIAQQNANTDFAKAKIDEARLEVDKASKEGSAALSSGTVNSMGLFPGTVVQTNGLGVYKVVSPAPEATVKDYMERVNQVHSDGAAAAAGMQRLNTYDQMLNAPGGKPAAGTFATIQSGLSNLLTSMGYPEMASGVLGKSSLSEASKAVIGQQITDMVNSPAVRSRLSFSPTQLETLQEGLPENLDNRDAQNLIIKITQGLDIQKVDAEAALNQHVAANGVPWKRDDTGKDGLEKATAILRQTTVPAYTSQTIKQESGAAPKSVTPVPTVQAPQVYKSPDDIKGAVQSGALSREAGINLLQTKFGFK